MKKSEMKMNCNTMKMARRLTASCLLLLAFAMNGLAQDDPQYVIKRTVGSYDHYLAHVKMEATMPDHSGNDSTYWYWVLRDVSVFHPDSCLWRSGPNVEHNYYFIDHLGKYRYLTAPLQLNGALSLSSHPGTALNNTTDNYYFYDWDQGIARGKKHNVASMADCDPNYHVPDSIGQCWEVVWLTCQSGWKMSSQYSYNPDPAYITNPAPYRYVTVTPHDEEISEEAGGITDLVIGDFSLEYNNSQTISIGTVSNYTYNLTPAYTIYDIEAVNKPPYYVYSQELHYFYDNTDHYPNGAAPSSSSHTGTVSGYEWSLSGEGLTYLTLTYGDPGNPASPTITCTQPNTTTSHKYATLTLTVTYLEEGYEPVTQTSTATITVLAQCQNPLQASAPVITYEDVTVSWVPTATKYKVYWKKHSESAWNNSHEVEGATSYAIIGLEYGTEYDYTVTAYCGSDYLPIPDAVSGLIYSFTTKSQPNGLIYGAVFGGGRMADVGGKTEVVIINCDSIGAVYGGNDIAGAVHGVDGSTIALGVNSGDDYDSYGTTSSSIGVKVGSVYGGGNGYYAYNGTSFVAATNEYKSQAVAPGASVNAMTPSHQVGAPVWTNEGTEDKTLYFPSIIKTTINVAANDHVKVDSLFGGAKNAFVTHIEDYDEDDNPVYATNGSTIIIKGGTLFAVFGGNNFGGTQGYGKHHIEVRGTKVSTNVEGYGTNFGIGYLFGGGNKVYGSTTEISITGGRCDTVFAGGNAASVYAANLTVNCAPGDHASSGAYGKIFSNAISGYSEEDGITVNSGYAWDGTGIYNVRALFGGNNQATMSPVPNLTLTSGSIGTVYGGGNAGDMIGDNDGVITFPDVEEINDYTFKYGTYVELNSPTILVDYLYGGCQMSNVGYSTWVKLQNGHVGTVYGGCNVSGDVGSTRVDLEATQFDPPGSTNPNEDYQEVYGATYVEASGGTVYKNLFAGSNGYYHCKDSYGITYIEGINYAPGHNYVGMDVPTHNETHVIVSGTVLVKGNVYAGGNLACVGFDQKFIDHSPYSYPSLVGLASVRMSGGTVDGNVFGGGNMASIYGSNEVRVWGGSIGEATGGALYGGNDRSGKAGQISNRVLPSFYQMASDGLTSLQNPKVCTYVGVSGTPNIHTVYGGGNGLYAYFTNFDDASAYTGPLEPVVTCVEGDLPIQKDIFVDIGINGGDEGGYVANVYGGGNGVSVEGFIKVFVNVQNGGEDTRNHVGTLFGGNNEGELYTTLPDIILLHGNVGTIYGGCNKGAMTGDLTFGTYENLGSCVYLRGEYTAGGTTVQTTGRVTEAVYGGCRMNGVTNNTLVLVEGGDHHTATLYGGSDISGHVGGVSQVYMTGGAVKDVYGGGNGNYDYNSTYLGYEPPYCDSTSVEMRGGECTGSIFAGGYAGECGDTYLLVGGGTVDGSIYGGGNRAGIVIESYTLPNPEDPDHPITVYTSSGNSSVEITGGTVLSGVYGGCNALGDIEGDVTINITCGQIGTDDTHTADVHGGGYGEATNVNGNIGITFGEVAYDGGEEVHTECPKLFGDLYGGSALGSVNTDASNNTTIHIDNGTVQGDVYGGGLGYKDANNPANDVAAMVYGEVHVYVGGVNDDGSYFGKASFIDCSIYGSNNLNGSPQTDVYVDVYQTAHTPKDVYTYTGEDRTYAIYQVFGGGNQADYAPEGGIETSEKVTHVFIHGCENTVEEVFGGSNAADANSVHTVVDGGRFNFIFGGGNGILGEANVGHEGIVGDDNEPLQHTFSRVNGGHVGYYFGASNRLGNCVDIRAGTDPGGLCGELITDYLFNGGNQADEFGDLVLDLSCSDQKTYLSAYGGCRLGTVYGTITINITGGIIGNLFGGCQGAGDYAANVKRFPTAAEIEANPGDYSERLKNYLAEHNDLYGTGGTITVNVYGGAIGNVFGGCDINGNVDGKITVNVESIDNDCGLFVGNVYGASNQTKYEPENPNGISPEVNIIKAVIGGGFDFNDDDIIQDNEIYTGNVFGGGNFGDVTTNPKVTIGPEDGKPVTIKGSVYGGGNDGNVNGSAQVIVGPTE